MQVNTSVVSALLWLKGLDTGTVANLVHVPHRDLVHWLSDDAAEGLVAFETQLEILALLGVREDAPRSDVVHYWRLHEGLFSGHDRTYESLAVILKAFGPAQASYIAQEADPIVSFKAKVHFALKFTAFMAVLEITAHPLKTISFDPSTMPELSWATGAQGILLDEVEFSKLEPGSLKVRGLHQSLTYTAEMGQWEKLRESAIEHGISAEQVATLLIGAGPKGPALTAQPRATATPQMGASGPTPPHTVAAQARTPVAPEAPQAQGSQQTRLQKPQNPRELFSKPVSTM